MSNKTKLSCDATRNLRYYNKRTICGNFVPNILEGMFPCIRYLPYTMPGSNSSLETCGNLHRTRNTHFPASNTARLRTDFTYFDHINTKLNGHIEISFRVWLHAKIG
jgi:hypothetical protein